MRWVSTRVLPEPAPATISSGEPLCVTAAALRVIEAVEQDLRIGAPPAAPAVIVDRERDDRRTGSPRSPSGWPIADRTAEADRNQPDPASLGRSQRAHASRCRVYAGGPTRDPRRSVGTRAERRSAAVRRRWPGGQRRRGAGLA